MPHDTITEQRIIALEEAVSLQRRRTHAWAAGCILTIACTGAFLYLLAQQFLDAMTARPPIAVLDVNRHVMQTMDADPNISPNEAMISAQETAVKLAGKGYVVLHKTSIVAVPEDYEVP